LGLCYASLFPQKRKLKIEDNPKEQHMAEVYRPLRSTWGRMAEVCAEN